MDNILDTILAININDYLKMIGAKIDVKKSKAHITWYYSPVRTETKSSFKVDNSKNTFYDFGEGKGGNIINLVSYIHNISNKEAFKLLKDGFVPNFGNSYDVAKEEEQKEGIKIHSLKAIESPEIIHYVTNVRKIELKYVEPYLKEAIISFPNSRYPEKKHLVTAFKNDKGGYDFRNEYIKLSNSPKWIRTVKGVSDEKINLFEGHNDFLAALDYFKISIPYFDTIILNSLSLARTAIDLNKTYILFLDNDDAVQRLLNDIDLKYIDKRKIFNGHKDFNEFLINKKL